MYTFALINQMHWTSTKGRSSHSRVWLILPEISIESHTSLKNDIKQTSFFWVKFRYFSSTLDRNSQTNEIFCLVKLRHHHKHLSILHYSLLLTLKQWNCLCFYKTHNFLPSEYQIWAKVAQPFTLIVYSPSPLVCINNLIANYDNFSLIRSILGCAPQTTWELNRIRLVDKLFMTSNINVVGGFIEFCHFEGT